MSEQAANPEDAWTLEEWEKALTIRVGTAFLCRECHNLVMVTKGGVGRMDLKCCGKPMEPIRSVEEAT